MPRSDILGIFLFKEETMTKKEVYFFQYCLKCKHYAEDEDEDPCNECLTYPSNEDSHKPINYEEAGGKKNG
jgi:hypothetical protein